jgi:4-amino-4-deoxy-L-arabinose transferase-like glycosyltransferase
LLTTRKLSFVLAGIVLVRFLTLPAYPILDKSEARYAYISELMVQTNNWVTPFISHGVPFWAKPILAFWLTAASFTLFGINAVAARLPAFLIYAAVGWLVFVLGRDQRDRQFGLTAACVFASTSLAFYLGGTVMTDPALMLGVTLVMASFWKCVGRSDETPSRVWGYLFFVGVAIGVLAKGPIGAILPGMSIVVWLTIQREWANIWRRLPWISGTALTLLLVIPWYALAEYRTPGFLHYFIIGEHFDRFLMSHWTGDLYGAGRPRPRGTIWLFGLIAGLPWSAALLVIFFRRRARQDFFKSGALKGLLTNRWLSYLLLWLIAPLVLFTLAANILITYVATSLGAFALLTAHACCRIDPLADRHRFLATAGIVPVIFLAAVIAILIDPGSRYLRSEAGIVATYKSLAAERPSEIIYAFDKPFSADFYTGGSAKFVSDSDGIAASLGKDETYFVVPEDVLPKLPDDLRQRLEVIVSRNHYVLLRPKAKP